MFLLPDNKWTISGDNRLLFFAQPTYGLGIYGFRVRHTPLV